MESQQRVICLGNGEGLVLSGVDNNQVKLKNIACTFLGSTAGQTAFNIYDSLMYRLTNSLKLNFIQDLEKWVDVRAVEKEFCKMYAQR